MFLLLTAVHPGLRAEDTIYIDNAFREVHAGSYTCIYEDPSGIETPESIRSKKFRHSEQQQIFMGFSRSVFWTKLHIINTTAEDKRIYYLFTNHYLDSVDMYILDEQDSVVRHSSEGAKQTRPAGRRETLYAINSLDIASGQTYSFYTRIRSATPLRIQQIFRTTNTYIESERKTHVFYGFYYGIISLMIFSLVYILIALRDRLYLYFLSALIMLAANSLAMDNILPAWSFPGRPELLLHLMIACSALMMFFYILFAEGFFSPEIRKYPGLIKIFTFLKIFAFLASVWYFVSYYSANKYIFIIASAFMLCLLIISGYLWLNKRITHVRFFFWATLVPLISSVTLSLVTAGVFQSFLISQYGLKVSYLAQIIIFLVAVGDRYYILQKDFTHMLRLKVKERTVELDNALKQLKSAQQQLVQSEKMASLGTLTTGISHEINNPLNYISGGLFLLEEHSEKKGDVVITEANYMDSARSMIREGFDKVHRIVTSLLSFSGRGESKRDLYDIHTILDNTLLILKPKIAGNIELIRDYRLEKKVPVCQDKMHQVFLNIFDNAIYALDRPGACNGNKKIRISTRIEEQKNGWCAVIEIYNNGGPIPDEYLNLIFDPFFTTRDPGEGVGLGLSITYTLVTEHQGKIKAVNRDDGVSFFIELPVSI